jgi:hypothetical protein
MENYETGNFSLLSEKNIMLGVKTNIQSAIFFPVINSFSSSSFKRFFP